MARRDWSDFNIVSQSWYNKQCNVI